MSILLSIPIFKQLLILMVVVWTIAVLLRRIGIPTIMGEFISTLIVSTFILNIIASIGLKGCAILLKRKKEFVI